jgi:hypothetical protein
MAAYSAMKPYLEKNNIHSLTFSPNTKKPIMAVNQYLPQTTQWKLLPTVLRN